jgi:hypothetical protein
VGVVDGCAAASLYAVGWDRAFSFDASRTVGQFVATRSTADVFRQDRFNNHPLFSFLDHLVYVATGSQDERLLRALPILCGATAVGLVGAAVARRFGAAAGHVAGTTLAVNAMALRQFREVRGYALVTLAAVVATLALLRLLRRHDGRSPGRTGTGRFPALLLACYGLALAVAIATHLFALALIPVHALVVVGSRSPPAQWLLAWGAAMAGGLVVQWRGIVDGLSTPPRHIFDPTFPLRLAANLLGGPSTAGMLVLVLVGWTVLRSRPWMSRCLTGTAILVVAAWLAGPSWLDSRFFIWLAPATSVAAGAAVARSPKLAALAAACVAVQLAALGPNLVRSEVPNRIAAAFVRASQDHGSRVCALGRTRAGLLAYVDDVRVIRTPAELATCDVAVEAAGPLEQPLERPACERFAFVLTLPARHPGAVFADRPVPAVAELLDDGGYESAWMPTGSAPSCSGP